MRRKRFDFRSTGLPVLFLVMIVVWGCGYGTDEAVVEEDPVEPVAEAEEATLPDLATQLALADAFDGAADHVVSRCLSCSLGMDGSPDHAMQFAGYELRFCSAGCMESFVADPEAKILALVVPEAQPESTEMGEVEPEG